MFKKMQESTMMFFTVCLLTLVINIATIQPVHGLEESSTAQRTERIRKRSYSPWTSNSGNSVSLYEAGNVYKPASYSLSRPYYIPVYGSQGKTLIYYPPQPIYLNPGAPSDNQFRGAYRGPAYIPPKVIPNPVTPNPVPSRMGGDDDDSDRPVWGSSGMVQMPLSGEQAKEWSATPTRPPMASRPARPPLIHDMDETQSETTKESPAQRPPIRTTTFRPTTQAPSGPSNCVWAIISCCSASNPSVLPQNCFEQRGCPGPFWGDSPCKSDFARAAIAAAVDYYSSNPNAAAGK